MTDPPPDAGWWADEALAAVGRLRTAWGWLGDLRLPGRVSATERFVTVQQERIEVVQVRRDRLAMRAALSGGTQPGAGKDPAKRGTPMVPIGPHPDAGRPGVIAARASICTTLATLAVSAATAAGRGTPSVAVPDPTMRVLAVGCGWCVGHGYLLPPPGWGWEWPPEPVGCPRCYSRGTIPTGNRCVVCGATGPCGCDLADAVVDVALALVAESLPDLPEAEETARALRTADRLARRVARVVDDRRRIHARCPACGQRELWADVSSTKDAEWSVSCTNPMCRCAPTCGCGRPVRYLGRRHRWPSREWMGRHGFAARIGVDLHLILRPVRHRRQPVKETNERSK